MAERVRFELTVVFSYARFPGVCLKPLSHLSNRMVEQLTPPMHRPFHFDFSRSEKQNENVGALLAQNRCFQSKSYSQQSPRASRFALEKKIRRQKFSDFLPHRVFLATLPKNFCVRDLL